MEMVAFRTEARTEAVAAKSLIVSTFVVETALAAQRSMLCLFLLADVLLKNKDGLLDLIGGDQRFPVDELHRRKRPETENVDGSDTEDDEEDDDDVEQDDDEGDEDFSGEEGGEDDEEGDPEEDPVANGNGGSDDEDDEDEDGDGDEDEDGEDEDDEEEEDEDEEDAPPAKKRK